MNQLSNELMEKYATRVSENMDIDDLQNFVFNAIFENLRNADPEEILEQIEYIFPDLLEND